MLLESTDEVVAEECRWSVTECSRCAVRSEAIPSALDASDLPQLRYLGRRVHVKRGQTLAWQGDDAAILGNVIAGILKFSLMTGDGQEQIVGLVFPSDFVGRPDGGEHRYGITALTDATLCVFRRSAFEAYALEHPCIQQALLRRTFDELERARRWMLLLGRKSAAGRVASLLVEMVERLGGTHGEAITLPLGRQQMADLLGLAVETVSRTLTKLKQAGIIALPSGRRLAVRQPAELIRIANG